MEQSNNANDELMLDMIFENSSDTNEKSIPQVEKVESEQETEQESVESGYVSEFSDSDESGDEDDKISKSAIQAEKRNILMKLKRLEIRKGIQLQQHLSMHSSIEDLRGEYEAICHSLGTDDAIDMMKQSIVLICTGIERFNSVYDPFSIYLDGWGASVNTTIDSKEELLEELYDKYYGSIAKTGPEFRLIFALTMSAVMYNVKSKIMSPENSSFLSKLAKDHAKGLQTPKEEDVDLSKIKWD